MQVHVEDLVLGTGDTAEQVVSLAGPLQQMQIAMPIILEKAGKVGKAERVGSAEWQCFFLR